MQVVLAGGGTAGHIEPALALADALRRRDPSVGITALGTARGLETRLVPARGYSLALIRAVPVPRRPSTSLITLPGNLVGAVREAAAALRAARADVVVGFGGYVAAPAYLAARRLGVPIVVHEANARPGLANRMGARIATRVAVSAAGVRLPRAEVVGIPLRRSITTLDRAARRDEARHELGLDADTPVLLVFGGSQGAQRINDALVAALPGLLELGLAVLHVHGRAQQAGLPAAVPGRYVPLPYLDAMELGYAAADLVLARAGALTCAELAVVGLGGLLVPLPIGNGEQRLNAAGLVQAGAVRLVADDELDGERLRQELRPFLDAPGGAAGNASAIAAMSAAARSRAVPDADERLADMVEQAAGVSTGYRPGEDHT